MDDFDKKEWRHRQVNDLLVLKYTRIANVCSTRIRRIERILRKKTDEEITQMKNPFPEEDDALPPFRSIATSITKESLLRYAEECFICSRMVSVF